MTELRVAVLFRRLQPYHVARLRACRDSFRITTIEVAGSPSLEEYRAMGATESDRQVLSTTTLFPNMPPERISRLALWRSLLSRLNEINPEVVAVPAWGESDTLICLYWARRKKRRAITLVESSLRDKPRSVFKEAIKERIVRLFDAAVAGGSPQTAYVRRLGMAADRVFDGYDVVDNEYFTSRSDRVRADRERYTKEFGLPDKFFLAANRFIPKKNLPALIAGYNLYRNQLGREAWSLIIMGDGPLKPEIERLILDRNLAESIRIVGMVPYAQLPVYYGLASGFIHASTIEQWGLVVNEAMASRLPVLVSRNCGCAPDLVQEGVNGYTFDPSSETQIADRMLLFHKNANRPQMGERSLEIISSWSPGRFAQGLAKAIGQALSAPPRGVSFFDGVILILLTIMRPFPGDAAE